jgi:hypothetical protein
MELHKHVHVNDFIRFGYDSTCCHQWHNKHFLSCTTIESAIEIHKLLKIVPSSVCALTTNGKGILIRPQSTRRVVHFFLMHTWLNTCNNILWWKVGRHMYILITKSVCCMECYMKLKTMSLWNPMMLTSMFP